MSDCTNGRIERMLKRHHFKVGDILYLTHEGQRTLLHLQDRRVIPTPVPMKTVTACFPADDFWSIQKGVVVARRYVVSIEGKGLYTMVDGRQFQGRGRNPAEHKRRAMQLDTRFAASARTQPEIPQSLPERCSIMDNAPNPFCLLELVFDPAGRGVDFVFRYCNKAMELLKGVAVERMLNSSFYEVFQNSDRKWIIPYADVAMNGRPHEMVDFSPKVKQMLRISCFQPAPGYCACLIMQMDDAPPTK